ncbi:MAG: PLP-dependent aminotransferase family protein [Clostridia bacterium]|nr:PLP-dependent aminotransferase family protein [Clostridia bacterium]
MKYSIDNNSNKSAYLQLYQQLRNDIAEGVYKYGAKLPSKRLLSEECGVSVITVEHAYAILCDEGYVEARQRSGYYVIYRKNDFTKVAKNAKEISLTPYHSSKQDFPFTVLTKTMRKVLSDYGERILIKSPNRGCNELRQAIADYLFRSNSMLVEPERIIIGSGAEYLYTLIVQLLGKERVFGLENPSYDKIHRVYSALGVECEMLRLGGDGIKTEELTSTKASVLHITPFNSFPSGVTADASKRSEYIGWAKHRQGYIVEDNFDSELTVSRKHEDTLFSLDDEGRVIYLNTFSRTVAPSMRVGYMILPKELIADFDKKLGFYSCTVPVFEQFVLAELINSGDFERHINRTRRKRRKLVI